MTTNKRTPTECENMYECVLPACTVYALVFVLYICRNVWLCALLLHLCVYQCVQYVCMPQFCCTILFCVQYMLFCVCINYLHICSAESKYVCARLCLYVHESVCLLNAAGFRS